MALSQRMPSVHELECSSITRDSNCLSFYLSGGQNHWTQRNLVLRTAVHGQQEPHHMAEVEQKSKGHFYDHEWPICTDVWLTVVRNGFYNLPNLISWFRNLISVWLIVTCLLPWCNFCWFHCFEMNRPRGICSCRRALSFCMISDAIDSYSISLSGC